MFQLANLWTTSYLLAFSSSEPMPFRALSCSRRNIGVDDLATMAHLLEAPGGEHNCHLLQRRHDTIFCRDIFLVTICLVRSRPRVSHGLWCSWKWWKTSGVFPCQLTNHWKTCVFFNFQELDWCTLDLWAAAAQISGRANWIRVGAQHDGQFRTRLQQNRNIWNGLGVQGWCIGFLNYLKFYYLQFLHKIHLFV